VNIKRRGWSATPWGHRGWPLDEEVVMGRITEWTLGIVGAIVAVAGLVILFAGEDQYLGFGGATQRVGDIPDAWGYGLLAGGVAALVLAAVLAIRGLRRRRSGSHHNELTALLTHAAVFTAVNALIWIEDIATGGGLEYAYWVTIPWGIGLLAHTIVYVVGSRPALPHH
jgi:hypothetical protein